MRVKLGLRRGARPFDIKKGTFDRLHLKRASSLTEYVGTRWSRSDARERNACSDMRVFSLPRQPISGRASRTRYRRLLQLIDSQAWLAVANHAIADANWRERSRQASGHLIAGHANLLRDKQHSLSANSIKSNRSLINPISKMLAVCQQFC